MYSVNNQESFYESQKPVNILKIHHNMHNTPCALKIHHNMHNTPCALKIHHNMHNTPCALTTTKFYFKPKIYKDDELKFSKQLNMSKV